jgi:plastocyanin domain-containing protein
MWRNRVYTVPFTFQVAELWGPSPEVAKQPTRRSAGVQRATIVIDGDYQPGQVRVKARQPVELTFVLKEQAGCGDVLHIPSLKLKRTLRPGEKTRVAFTPQRSGTIAFTCGMNMYRGQVLVR